MSFAFFFYNYLLPGIVATIVMIVFILIFKIATLTPPDWDLVNNGYRKSIKEILPIKNAYVSFFITGSIIHPLLLNLWAIRNVFDTTDPTLLLYYFLFISIFMILLLKDNIPHDKRIRIGFIIIFLHILYSWVFWIIWQLFHHLGWEVALY